MAFDGVAAESAVLSIDGCCSMVDGCRCGCSSLSALDFTNFTYSLSADRGSCCEEETGVVAHSLIKLQANYAQLLNLRKGLKEYSEEGMRACKRELGQMHDCICWRAVAICELTRWKKQCIFGLRFI